MTKMTHGELRGLLMLIGLMMIVVIYAWIFKAGSSESSTSSQQSTELADTLQVAAAARHAQAIDSVRRERQKVARASSDSISPSNTGKPRQSKHRAKTAKSAKNAPAPVPSPLDRKIPQ